MVPMIPRPPYGPPPCPPPMMRLPQLSGPPPDILGDDLLGPRPFVPPKPSYVKSAAPTVVKRSLAQHAPELTVPISVRVRLESPFVKLKPNTPASTSTAPIQAASSVLAKPAGVISSTPTP